MEDKKNLKLVIVCIVVLLAIIGGVIAVIFIGADSGNSNGDANDNVSSNAIDKGQNQDQNQGGGQSNQQSTGLNIELSEDMFVKTIEYTNADKETESAYKNSVLIDLNNGAPKCVNSSVKIEGTTVTILASGKYTITGTMDEGQIIVNPAVSDDKNVKIMLDGVSISNSKSAPFVSKAAGKTVITLKDGTENAISDLREANSNNSSSDDTDSTETEEDNDSAIWCENDLSINGSGKLKVTANYESGIKSKDDLVVYSGEINVDAVNNALVGNDSVAIKSGTFTLKADNNGVRCKTNDDIEKGYIVIDGGEYDINVSGSAIKSDFTVVINGGKININAGNDAVHGEYGIQVNKGEVLATKCEEGIEGAYIVINDGIVDITSSDDGINASGIGGTEIDNGFDMNMPGGERPQRPEKGEMPEGFQRPEGGKRPEGERPQKSNGENMTQPEEARTGKGGMGAMGVEDACLIINGGMVRINAGGDGLDSNGELTINGGEVYVNGPTSNGNSSLDSGKEVCINGGNVVVVGSSGMLEAPSTNGKQNTIVVAFNSLAAGSVVVVKDETGNEIISYEAPKTFSSLIYSSDKLKNGETYTVTSGSETLGTLTISSSVTTTGKIMGGFGGMGGFMR